MSSFCDESQCDFYDDHVEDSSLCDADSGDGEQILDDPALCQSVQSNKHILSGAFKGV